MTSPKRAGRPGAISSIGLTGAPAAAAPVAVPPPANLPPLADVPAPPLKPVPTQQQVRDGVASRPHDPVTSSRVRFSAPPAVSDTTTSYTLRMHVEDAEEVDELRAKLRRWAGRRALDQAEVVRVLLRLAIDDDSVRAALVSELTKS